MTTKTLRPRLCATLAATLAVSTLIGCDPDVPEDGVGTETEGDGAETGGSAAETDSGLVPDDDDGADASSGEGPDDSDGPDSPQDPTDDGPFDDDPEAALGALSGMGYVCYDPDDISLNLYFNPDGVTVLFEDDTTSEGSYDTAGGSLTLSFPELGFVESALDATVALDALVYFETPSLRCGAYFLDHTVPEGIDVVDCPKIKYVPGTTWENNQFRFGDGGYVQRRRWTELLTIPDTLYSERLGVYRVVGNQMFIVLPFEDEGEQWLTGTLTDGGLYIDQLEPEQGACE